MQNERKLCRVAGKRRLRIVYIRNQRWQRGIPGFPGRSGPAPHAGFQRRQPELFKTLGVGLRVKIAVDFSPRVLDEILLLAHGIATGNSKPIRRPSDNTMSPTERVSKTRATTGCEIDATGRPTPGSGASSPQASR